MNQQQPVLIYDRIGENKRNTRLFLGLFGLILLPVAVYVALYVTLVVAVTTLGLVGPSGDDWQATLALVSATAVSILLVTAILQYHLAAGLILRIAGARPLRLHEEEDLRRTVENLCIGAGLRPPKVYVIERPAPNAFTSGPDPRRASLALTRGLLSLLDRSELEGVIAHELSHIGNYDTRLSTVVATGVAFLLLPLTIIRMGVGLYLVLPVVAAIPLAVNITTDLEGGDSFLTLVLLFSTLLAFYVLFVAPALGHLLRLALLRQREFLADADAVLLTRYPEGLARALAKMDGAWGLRLGVGAATAHLYIVDPLTPDAHWWERIFSSHPPIENRIELLAEMGDGIPPSTLNAAAQAGAEFARSHAADVVPGTAARSSRSAG
jgi:heat shock protein HtpX